jgi:hypothetical protein
MFKFNRNPKHFLRMLEIFGERDLTSTDIVSLNEPLRSVLNGAVRTGKIRLEDLAKDLRLSLKGASQLADVLVKKGLFHPVDGMTYDVRVSGKTYGHERPRTVELWAKFDDKDDDS